MKIFKFTQLLFLFLMSANLSFAQENEVVENEVAENELTENELTADSLKGPDLIILRDGLVIRAKVLEIGYELIKYKKSSYPNGPTYNIYRKEVYAINYPNDKVDYFVSADSTKFRGKNRSKKTGRAKKGIAFRLGGGFNYLYGADTDNNKGFDSDFVSLYGETMLGYVFNHNRKGLGTVIGGFLSVGNLGGSSVQKFLADGRTDLSAQEVGTNLYYQLELGVVLFETFRLSSGTGYQRFKDFSDERQEVYYYSTTTGFHFGLPFAKLTADLNFLYGRDLKSTILRPTVGLVFQL